MCSTALWTGFAASPTPAEAEEDSGFVANARIGFIDAGDEAGGRTRGSAIGGKLGYISPDWHGLSGGVTIYTTQKLADSGNGSFFASDGTGYSILGEAFVAGILGNTLVKFGRFELDTPHADTDDIGMIPNTFQGALVANTDVPGATMYFAHLDQWAGIDADIPETFEDINNGNGITALGIAYEGGGNLDAQGWLYSSDGFARLLYLEAVYERGALSIGVQFGSQSDKTQDSNGPEGDVYGVTAGYTIGDFTLIAAYNKVEGTVINGYGGGPYFTSAEDHTIERAEDQAAVAGALEYSGIQGLALGALHVDFDRGADETDYYVSYEVSGNLGVELVYADMHEDGDFVRLMGNYSF